MREQTCPLSRRQWLAISARLGVAGLAGPGGAATARAQSTYPASTIRLVIPTAPGGGHDIMMRLISQKLTESWAQPVIVESRAGASGAIAAATVARTAGDGYTLMLNYSALLTNLALQSNPGYRITDFAPVCMLALTPIALGVRQSLGVNTLAQFVELARSQPGKLSYASYGPGSGGHFIGELLNDSAGISVTHVPYKGEAPAIQDLLGEQVDAVVASLGGVSRHPGRIRALAVAGPNRFPTYPDVPTFVESGHGSVNMPGWGALFAPAATPRAIVEKVAAEMNRIVRLPDVANRLLELGFEPVGWPPDRLADFLKDQTALINRTVTSGRVKI